MKKDLSSQKEEKKQIQKNIDSLFPLPNPTNDKVVEQFAAWKGTDVGEPNDSQSKNRDKICC